MTQPDDDIEQAVAMLRRSLQQRVTPEVRARHLGSVQRQAAQMRLEQRRHQRAARRPRVALLAALVGAMLLGTSSAALAASGSSLPGQLLYPVKRGGEEVRLIMATPFSAQGGVQLDIAAARVHEALVVAQERPEKVPGLLEEAFQAMAAAEAAGAPQVAQVTQELREEAGAAIAIAEVAPEVVAALPASGLSEELALTTETDTTTATLPDEPSRSGTLGAPGSGSASPEETEIDPVTGDPILGSGIAETSTATPSPSPSPSPFASDD